MSRPGVNTPQIKQEGNQFRKDNRGPNSTPNNSNRDDKRSSGNFNTPNQQGHGNQHNRDRSGNRNDNRSRNDNRQHDKSDSDNKNNDKDKSSTDNTTGPGGEKKFTGRCRLFVGNLTPDVTEDDFKKMFEVYGEISEVYVNTSRGFGFIRLDYRQNAEAAKAALDGLQRKGRILRVRFATHGAALKVKNLHSYVSNELLEQSFSQFGDLERCVVIVDDRGKATGEGIVEFVRKPGANSALRRISEGVFLMGADPKPVGVEPLEQKDEEDGMPEKFLTKTDQYKKEREKEPRFAPPGTFEYEFGMRWKQLEELEKQRIEQVKRDTEEARIKLEDEMQNALYEYQAEQIRQDLVRQQEELRRLEELRNQDRLRRQQESELRRQQEDRERAQADERRRADMMMNMRQQEIARGRGPMDAPGMRGREEMMMADRYGDRMPDRMGDRMPERMGDRMGPGMWDEKRGEAGMRGEPGRGREMRGSGAPPLQPPPVPPSAVNAAMERGAGPVTAAQNVKSSPKPLMQGGFMGGPGGGSGPSPLGPDAGPNAMDEDSFIDDAQFEDAEGMFDSELSSKCDSHQIWVATKSSFSAALNKFQFEDKDYAEGDLTPSCHVRISTLGDCQARGAQDIDERNTSELWKTDVDYRLNGDVEAMDSKQDLPQQTESSLTDSEKQTTPNGNTGCHPSDTDYRTTPQYTSSCKYSPNNSTEIHCSAECQLEEDCNLVSDIPCDENMRNLNSCNTVRSRSVPCSSGGSLNSDLPNSSDIKSFTKSSSVQNLSQKCLDQLSETKNGEHYASIDDSFGQIMDSKPPETYDSSTAFDKKSDNDCDREETTLRYSLSFDANTESDHREEGRNKDDTRVIQQYLSSEHVIQNDNEEKQNGKVGLQRYLSSDNHSNCDNLVVHVEDNHILTESDSGQCKSSESLNSSQNPSLHQQSPVPADVCLNVDSKCVNYEFDNAPNKSDYQCDEDRLSYDQIDPDESEYKQNLKECNSSLEGEYKQSLNGQKQSLNEDGESCYAQEDIDQPSVSNFKQSKEDKNQSSYKQPPAGEVEDMDTETLDEDVEHETLSPSIYQSYEEGAMDYHNAAISALGVPVLAEYNTEGIDSHGEGWAPAVNDRVSFSQLANSDSYSSSSTYTLTQNTVTDTATSSSQDHVMTNPSTSSSSYSSLSSQSQSVGPSTEDHEGALCTGDQTFKSAAARQSALGSFTQNIRSVPFVSSINPSVYAGPAVVQGINRPAIMSSSTVHIAQHPGGATIMRHQSMSAGLSGGMAQATLMQRHAMPNGAQSTSLLQQRTLTNGGQTMVMQQRTMTTGLGAMSQQTVVQQRMTAPNNIAQAAMYQASAMRQQAKIIQQRAIRLAQAQVMGSQLLRAQAYGSAALVQRGAANPSASLIRPGLVRAGGQASVMQHLVRQRYLGGPVMPGRGMQMVAGRPVRVKMTYPRESLSNT